MKNTSSENNTISLTEFISQNYKFNRTEDEKVIVILDDGRTLQITELEFKRRCAKDYYHTTGTWPSKKELSAALSDAGLATLAETTVIDLVDGNYIKQDDQYIFRLEDGRQRVVSAKANEIVSRADSGVHFTKDSGSGYAIPTPTDESLIDILSKRLNMTEEQILLFIGCQIKCFMSGPNPVMLFIGPQGSGKTLAAKIFKMIVDPDNTNDRVRIMDNQSVIGGKLSDDICRESHDHILIITTISQLMPNQDLVGRAIVLDFKPIPDSDRIPETKILTALKNDLTAIIWWLFSGLSSALERYQEVELLSYPRLADFIQAIVAACPGLNLNVQHFLEVFDRNRIELVERSLNQNPVSAAILDFMDKLEEDSWSGTATALLELLNDNVADDIKQHTNWPSKPNKFSAMLNRAAPFLKTRGLDIQWAKSGQRSITLVKLQAESEEQESSQESMVEFHERQTAANADEEAEASVSAKGVETVSVPARSSKPDDHEVAA
jgi:hypothetical protein